MDMHLSLEQRAIARLFQKMIEHHLFSLILLNACLTKVTLFECSTLMLATTNLVEASLHVVDSKTEAN